MRTAVEVSKTVVTTTGMSSVVTRVEVMPEYQVTHFIMTLPAHEWVSDEWSVQ